MTETAGVFNNHRDVTKIRALPYRRFNADFHGDADNGKGIDAAIPQRDVKRGTFERRHGDLVEDGFAWQWIHLRNQMESRRVPQEPRLDLVWRFHRCYAIAMRNCDTPISSFGNDIWRVKTTRISAFRAD